MNDRQEIVDSVALRLGKMIPQLREEPDLESKDLRDYAEFDSLGILEVLVWLEDEFAVSIPDEELRVENFKSVGMIVDYVIAHR
ncbi:phosphopantetheine-binding protein [Streptomyces sp. NPDC057620]|uniref:phosphopantetheine-binding protein n=1 Tax=Streptomyces sp. NPDC057620 TaxID=3346185 RepID=UPI003676AC13